MLLNYEKERCAQLENRINQKDEVVAEMTSLQNELYQNIEELQDEIKTLRHKLSVTDEDSARAHKDLEDAYRIQRQHEKEVTNLKYERDQAKEVEKNLKQEIEYLKNRHYEDTSSAVRNEIWELKKLLRQKDQEKEETQTKMRENIMNLQCELDNKDMQLTKTQGKISDLTEELEELRHKHQAPSGKRYSEPDNQLKRENLELKQMLQNSKPISEVEKLHKQISNLEEQLYRKGPNEEYSKVCREVMSLLGVSEVSDILHQTTYLLDCFQKSKDTKKLVEKMSSLLLQMSPQGTFERKPNNKQIWKWFIRVLEQYMQLKQTLKGGLINELQSTLNCGIPEIAKEVRGLVKNRKY